MPALLGFRRSAWGAERQADDRRNGVVEARTDLALCDSEPIHIPGSIQPHGVLLVAARDGLMVWQVAGDVETWLGVADWQGAPLAALLNAELVARLQRFVAADGRGEAIAHVAYIGQLRSATGAWMDASAYLAGLAGTGPEARDMVVIELEPAAEAPLSAALVLDQLDEVTTDFQRATGLDALCRTAAAAVRRFTGFDRALVYRFGEDDAGKVLAEDRREGMKSFLNHQFPASDIPSQARALYVRNLTRVIPDIHYTAAPLRPPAPGAPLDLSDSGLRSVSPIHLQYMFNMGMRASASFSIVKDGVLWGLIACHNENPRRIAYEMRVACRNLAAALAREVKSREDAEGYRQRLRLRAFEDDLVRLLSREGSLDETLSRHLTEVLRVMTADGVAILRGTELVTAGQCPPRPAVQELAAWVAARGSDPVYATDRLAGVYPPASGFATVGGGLLSLVLSAEDAWMVLWFRAEQVEVVNWAGNPHKDHTLGPDEQLSPRASFDVWVETVRGRARSWTPAELETAGRLRAALLDVRQNRRVMQLNRQLTDTLHAKDGLLQQKEFLMGEVNHRVQNSLQLVSSFLSLQARSADAPAAQAALEEAGRRLSAVGLVHKRLYRGDQIETLDAARYIEELCEDAVAAMGTEWRPHLSLDLAPVTISTDRAVVIGLVLTELMINVNKYAYGGTPGPIAVRLSEQRTRFQLSVTDRGAGRRSAQPGFGSRMMAALVQQLDGALEYEDSRPGVRAMLTAPSGTAAVTR